LARDGGGENGQPIGRQWFFAVCTNFELAVEFTGLLA
jgi:hypothetical protein